MIGIIKYNAGNITSVMRALKNIGQEFVITDEVSKLEKTTHVIFPGVGAAGAAMNYLRHKKLDVWLKDWAEQGGYLLGICLGTQIILDYSEENETSCIGLVAGQTKRFPEDRLACGNKLKIPHMGWNRVFLTRSHPLFADVPPDAEYYFVHSFYPKPAQKELVLGITDYGIEFCSALAKKNLVAVQFHPEKSGRPGLQILRNFCAWRGHDF